MLSPSVVVGVTGALVLLLLLVLPSERCDTKPVVRSPSCRGAVHARSWAAACLVGVRTGSGAVATSAQDRASSELASSECASERASRCYWRSAYPWPHFIAVCGLGKLRVSEQLRVTVLFVGARNKMTRPQRLAIRHEERAHGTRLCSSATGAHAVAKSLAWWRFASRSCRHRGT